MPVLPAMSSRCVRQKRFARESRKVRRAPPGVGGSRGRKNPRLRFQGSTAKVGALDPETPAAVSGLKLGDILLKVGDTPIVSSEDVIDASYFLTAGDNADIEIIRGSEKMTISVRPGLHPACSRARNAGDSEARWHLRGSIWNSRLFAAALFLGVLPVSGWEIESFGGHDYVPLGEAATFYGLGEETSPAAGSKNLHGGSREVLATRNSREIVIDGVRRWLAFPVMEEEGRLFVSRLDLGKTINPAFRPTLINGFPAVTTVVLDPGRGGKTTAHVVPTSTKKISLWMSRAGCGTGSRNPESACL